jgi:hypothetical protein
MASFTTFNQFDPKFKLAKFGNDCNACPLFALFTAKKFMDNGSISQEQHEKNLEAAVMNYVLNENHKELPKYLSFEELLHFTGGTFNDKQIIGTTPEIINQYGYETCFNTASNTNYCTIFLKNSNYIIVLVKHNPDGSKLYCLRDCHENNQYNFDSFDALQVCLSERYQFNQLTIVDGVLIEEYGNIEYLLIDKQFPIIILDTSLYDDEDKVEEDNVDMSFDISKLSPDELKEMGFTEPKVTTKVEDVSLDELMALQLQYGDDAY